MTTSATQATNRTRDQIITRALRICNAIGQGETPATTAVTEASLVLNEMCQEWNADGMPIWQWLQYDWSVQAGFPTYLVYTGSAGINAAAPLRIFQAWFRHVATTTDTPIALVTRQEYNLIGNKQSQGFPNQLYYRPPQEVQAWTVAAIRAVKARVQRKQLKSS